MSLQATVGAHELLKCFAELQKVFYHNGLPKICDTPSTQVKPAILRQKPFSGTLVFDLYKEQHSVFFFVGKAIFILMTAFSKGGVFE